MFKAKDMKIVLLLALFGFAGAALAQDASAGKEAYKECAACHSTKSGETLLGPSLAGVYDRKAGTVEGFRYSAAMKAFCLRSFSGYSNVIRISGAPKMFLYVGSRSR